MKNNKPKKAFILAAGHGSRMHPLTEDKPKPMVALNGLPLIRHITNKLNEIDVHDIIINLYYLGDRIKEHFENDTDNQITFSEERELLDTGGGIKNALKHLNNEDFFLINGDAFWIDTPDFQPLNALATHWNPDQMDILMLLEPIANMHLTKPVGDYDLDSQGRAIRNLDKKGQYMFTGVRISKSTLFDDTPDSAFSYLEIMDKAEKNGTLYALENKSEWHHISTPGDLERVEQYLQSKKAA